MSKIRTPEEWRGDVSFFSRVLDTLESLRGDYLEEGEPTNVLDDAIQKVKQARSIAEFYAVHGQRLPHA